MIYEKELSKRVIGCALDVYHTLGYGFLEKIYEKSLMIELERQHIKAKCQLPIKVYYQNIIVGDYFADIVVENKIILELKHVNDLNLAHEAQLLNYLKATGIKVGYLINFGKPNGLDFKRLVF
jgi:GxxExxY protein